MSAHKKKVKRKPRINQIDLPDLTDILHAFNSAFSLVTVAHRVISEGNDYGPEEYVLRMGVNALDAVYKRLDEADLQITRFRGKIPTLRESRHER